MGLDRVTALMEPRVTSLLATFLWMAEDDENKSVGDSKTPAPNEDVGTETELPVRTSLKAASTLVESNADVSINMRPFFSGLVSVVENKGGGNHNELTLMLKEQ